MTATGLAPAAGAVASDLARPHHDGSDAYVLEQPAEDGGQATVRLRVPRGAAVESVALRHVRDGEPRLIPAVLDEETDTEAWWRASFPVWNPDTRYRWLLAGGAGRYTWLNGNGLVAHEVPDADDFVLSKDTGGPGWHLDSVVYEIFPDRFATSGLDVEPPAWAIRRRWDQLPAGRGQTAREWFGGDLPGIERHLDHLGSLGANVIYLRPFFPAGSTHRYDATTFEQVDPLLGGDAALVALVSAAHARGIRIVGDLTTNHTGAGHPWFLAARDGRAAPERSFYLFDPSLPSGYESWFGVPSLPKLNWQSADLRARMAAVVRRWLEPPFDLDGWRIDVANMTGRYRDADVNREAAELVRSSLESAREDGLLVAEHGSDFRADLAAGGWHGVMNNAGFLRPVWWWLRSSAYTAAPFGDAPPAPRLDGPETVATMRAFRAGVAWPRILHSWTMLDSFDTPRFGVVCGSWERHVVGVGLQATTPGVPMICAGDELGLGGAWGEDARRPMPWDRPEQWDDVVLGHYRELMALRRSSPALARGGIRYAFVDEDVIGYLRETAGERLLCLASRGGHEPVRLSLAKLGCDELEALRGPSATYENGDAVLPADGPAFAVWRLA
jgi:alpha-glucosidase